MTKAELFTKINSINNKDKNFYMQRRLQLIETYLRENNIITSLHNISNISREYQRTLR